MEKVSGTVKDMLEDPTSFGIGGTRARFTAAIAA